MKNNSLLPLCIAILLCFCFAQCKKTKIEPTELSKLPAATQIGANTFGCLVNGKAWIAQTDCKFLCDAPFKITYDAGGGGNIAVTGKFINNDLNTDQTLSFGIDSTNFKNIFDYELLGDAHVGFTYINSKIFNNCRYLLSISKAINA